SWRRRGGSALEAAAVGVMTERLLCRTPLALTQTEIPSGTLGTVPGIQVALGVPRRRTKLFAMTGRNAHESPDSQVDGNRWAAGLQRPDGGATERSTDPVGGNAQHSADPSQGGCRAQA